jgi:hypothetical protein
VSIYLFYVIKLWKYIMMSSFMVEILKFAVLPWISVFMGLLGDFTTNGSEFICNEEFTFMTFCSTNWHGRTLVFFMVKSCASTTKGYRPTVLVLLCLFLYQFLIWLNFDTNSNKKRLTLIDVLCKSNLVKCYCIVYDFFELNEITIKRSWNR